MSLWTDLFWVFEINLKNEPWNLLVVVCLVLDQAKKMDEYKWLGAETARAKTKSPQLKQTSEM